MKAHKKILISLSVIPVLLLFSSCNKGGEKYIPVKELHEYIYEVDKYNKLDFDYADQYFKTNYDNWGGGCSAISKKINGDTVVGRNMDLNISNKCAYIIKTDSIGPNTYDTVGLAYTFREVSPDYEEVKRNGGISENWHKILPFMCDDVLNEEGLYIEINMRHAECYPNGEDKFSCEGTAANKELRRIYVFEIPRYVATYCKTVDEALYFLHNSVNIYNKSGYWNYAFIIADATGASCLVEIGKNQIYVTRPDEDGVVGQANFYVHEELAEINDTKTGLGRLELLNDNIDSVDSEEKMFNLMERVNYFQFYTDECEFDGRSEMIGEKGEYTYDKIMNHTTKEEFDEIKNKMFGPVAKLARSDLRNLNAIWETTFTEVVNCNNKTLFVKIFEKEETPYKVTLTF